MTDIILHIGAHRTGSTAVEQTLSANHDLLRAEGRVVWTPLDLRQMDAFVCRRGQRPTGPEKTAMAREVEATAAAQLVISEENMIGQMNVNMVHGEFYDRAKGRMTFLRDLFPVLPRRIALGLRDYESYWLSSYAYVIARSLLPPFEALAPGMVGARRGWLDLVDDLREVFPDADILVWPREALRGRELEIACRMIDRETTDMAARPGQVNPSLGPKAIPQLYALRKANPDIWESKLSALVAAGEGPDLAPFEGFDRSARDEMATRYSADLAALSRGYEDVTFLSQEGLAA
ncbi:MAG: hypothetical protein ACRBCL_03165 [Maritimibacter sp.]